MDSYFSYCPALAYASQDDFSSFMIYVSAHQMA
jgi:hypothetical protein